jgi:hypothetical protein
MARGVKLQPDQTSAAAAAEDPADPFAAIPGSDVADQAFKNLRMIRGILGDVQQILKSIDAKLPERPVS